MDSKTRRPKRYAFLTLFVLLSCFFFSCNSRSTMPITLHELSGIAMTIPYRILIPLPSESQSAQTLSLIEEEIEKIFSYTDRIFNSWNPASELSSFNKHATTAPFHCSWDLFYFLVWIRDIHSETDGYFDPAVETVNVVWRPIFEESEKDLFKTRPVKAPDTQEIEQLRDAASWSTLEFHFDSTSISKKYAITQIDLSAVIKGYTVDLLARKLSLLAANKSIYVEWGGEIATMGRHPEHRPWKIQLATANSAPLVMDFTQGAIATSGDCFQRWVIHNNSDNGIDEYTHIFCPGEAAPLEKRQYTLSSVSVACPESCALSDAFATAIFATKTVEKAQELARRLVGLHPSMRVIFFDIHGKKYAIDTSEK